MYMNLYLVYVCLCVFNYVLSMLQDARFLASQSNEILTAIVQGMRKEEQSNRVKLAATKALLNSLEFTKANFEKEVCLPTLTPYPFTLPLPPPHLTLPPSLPFSLDPIFTSLSFA